MGPGLLGGFYEPEEIRSPTQAQVEKNGGCFIQERVVRIAAEKRELELESGETLGYDILSLNTGSYVPHGMIREKAANIFMVKPIASLLAARTFIRDRLRKRKLTVAVVGGGPAAVEIVGNLRRLGDKAGCNRLCFKLCAGRKLLARFPVGVRRRVTASLKGRAIEVLEEGHVNAVYGDQLELVSGLRINFDAVLIATGVRPLVPAVETGLLVQGGGGLAVNRFLQSWSCPEIFGGGDCIAFTEQPLDKVGVYAVRQNPVLFYNLRAALENRPLRPFSPGGDYLQIFNLGDGSGLLYKWGLTCSGKSAFRLKDYIDRQFMRRFT